MSWVSGGKNCLMTQRGFDGLSSSTASNVLPKPPCPIAFMALYLSRNSSFDRQFRQILAVSGFSGLEQLGFKQ